MDDNTTIVLILGLSVVCWNLKGWIQAWRGTKSDEDDDE